MVASLLILVVLPYVVLFIGRVFVADSPIDGLQSELPSVAPLIVQSLLTAGLLGSLAMVIAAHTPRRAYATVGIIAALIIPSIVVAVLHEEAFGQIGDILVLLSPNDVLDGLNAALFDTQAGNPVVVDLDLPGYAYLAAAIVMTVAFIGLTIRRYQRISA
jgi:hypothetical protein